MKKLFSCGVIISSLVLGLIMVIPGAAAPPPDNDQKEPTLAEPGAPQPAANQLTTACSAWSDDFSTGRLDTSRWVVSNGHAPGYIPNLHIGYFLPGNVSLAGGLLTLTLNQQAGTVDTNSNGVISNGAQIYTSFKCGYGTYEWKMRMSSSTNGPGSTGVPISGSVSAGFTYVNNSQTEIDFEFSAIKSGTIWLVNWLNPTPQSDPTSANETYTASSLPDLTSSFHEYKFVWSPGKISYYIDGTHIVDHTTNVPSAPAYFMINHWGTDSPYWGGYATLSTPRNFYVSHVSYTPPQKAGK